MYDDHDSETTYRFHEFIGRKVGSRAWVVDDGQGPDRLKRLGFRPNQVIPREKFEEWRAEFAEQTGLTP